MAANLEQLCCAISRALPMTTKRLQYPEFTHFRLYPLHSGKRRFPAFSYQQFYFRLRPHFLINHSCCFKNRAAASLVSLHQKKFNAYEI
jgi:hypothetical protein